MTQLRMRGFLPTLVVFAIIAAWPGAFILYEHYVRQAFVEPMLIALTIGTALMPWLSRLVGRLTYRAALDDIALHVAGEALPWNTVTAVREQHSWRRSLLIVERGRTTRIVLVTRDIFAGRLEPIVELRAHLAKHGK